MNFAHQSKGYDDYEIMSFYNRFQRIQCSNGNFIDFDGHLGCKRRYIYKAFQGFQSYQDYQSYQGYQNFQGDLGDQDYQGDQSYQDYQGFKCYQGKQGFVLLF